MNAKKVFCEECRNDVDYIEASAPMVGTIKGKACRYVGKEAHCAACGSQLFVPEFLDYNLRELYAVYREGNSTVLLTNG